MNLSRDEKLEQLERILQSQVLHGSESLRAFLRFVVQKAVDEQEGQLKEYTIATEVFGRGEQYSPRTDSVVRVQASRLRSKLQEYYFTEGKADQLLIELLDDGCPVGLFEFDDAPATLQHPQAGIGTIFVRIGRIGMGHRNGFEDLENTGFAPMIIFGLALFSLGRAARDEGFV